MFDAWTDLYVAYGCAAGTVLLCCVTLRLLNGASPFFLMRSRCYELPPIRATIHAVRFFVVVAAIAALAVAVYDGWGYFQAKFHPQLDAAIIEAVAGLLLVAVAVITTRRLVRIPSNRPPAISVSEVKFRDGIHRHHLETIGKGQFPQSLAYGHTTGLWVRGVLVTTGVAALCLGILSEIEWGRERGLPPATHILTLASYELPPLPQEAIIMCLATSLGASLLLAMNNRSYTLVQFPTSLVLTFGLAISSFLLTASLDWLIEHRSYLVAGLCVLWILRWGIDMSRAGRFRRTRDAMEPIRQRVAETVPFLEDVRRSPECRLAPLDANVASRRIAQGCRNVEGADAFVTRNFGRFMRLIRVEQEAFTAAMLRFLTVSRSVSSTLLGGTNRALQSPRVPMWNETLFPIHAPDSFKNWLDPLPLGSQWDVVQTCATCAGTGRAACLTCGGSGRQRRSETRTTNVGGQSQSHTVYVESSCSSCGGSGYNTCSNCQGYGHVVFQQTLNTMWQRLLPMETAPHVHVAEFMEDADERVFCRVPLVEDRARLEVRPRYDGPSSQLKLEMARAAETLAAELDVHVKAVEELHGGILYRADFQVTGFWTQRIRFRRLPGRVGWFFGARPEFHFPRLPLSWGAVGTALFVVPFLLGTMLLGGEWAFELYETVHANLIERWFETEESLFSFPR